MFCAAHIHVVLAVITMSYCVDIFITFNDRGLIWLFFCCRSLNALTSLQMLGLRYGS